MVAVELEAGGAGVGALLGDGALADVVDASPWYYKLQVKKIYVTKKVYIFKC